jgi:hypothetical protein
MRGSDSSSILRPMVACLASLLLVAVPVRAQQGSSGSSGKDSQPVVKTFGAEGGFRSEERSTTVGKLTEDERKQASLLAALVFEHVDKAGDCIDAGEPKSALKDVNKGLEAIQTIRTMLPRTTIVTRITAPDGKMTFEDETEYQDGRIPLFAAVLHAQTLAPILAARKNAMEVAGYHVAESELIASEAIADIDPIEVYLKRAAKEIQDNKPEVASKSLALTLVRGIEVRVSKEDSELVSARDAIGLARRSLEENNPAQALVNLAVAKQRLRVYSEFLSASERSEVDQMLREVAHLEDQLRQEGNRKATQADRNQQGSTLTSWWNKINGWFKRHL